MEYLKENIDITSLSNFKTPTKTKFYFEINRDKDLEKLIKIIKYSKEKNLEILFIGGGTNLLFAFDLFNGIIIKNNLNGWSYNNKTKELKAYSGEFISDIAETLEKKYEQKLWHRFIGLPGTIGGAIYGNAGCFGLEAENNFKEAKVIDLESGQIKKMSKTEMKFSYRNSVLKEKGKYFLIESIFDLSKKIEKYNNNVDNIYFREVRQPKGNTCGSFFKNPSKENSAGSLIEKIGFKGKKIGGAYFSELHGNFLMSDGTATYKDLIKLIKITIEKIKKEYNIELIPEVKIIYNLK